MTTRSRYTAAITDSKPWWLAGGIDPEKATVVFQAKGAASLNSTYLNLVTGNTLLNSNVCTGWTPSTGWYMDGNQGNYNLSSSVFNLANLDNNSVSWIIKIDSPGIDNTIHSPFRVRTSGGTALLRVLATTGTVSFWNVTTYASSSVADTGVYACAGLDCYINGLPVGSITPGNYGNLLGYSYGIGTENNGANDFIGYIHAIAFYKTGLTQFQVQAVTDAMNAL